MDTEKPSPDVKKETLKSSSGKPVQKEVGGFEGRPEPTRFGDWDVNGRCSDF